MRKREIDRKFDEIVDFSGVERYIDTPVKRYSSGMYVRLAFAVAAHLESEILIVDEVLAVGDGEFQKKCLGKMGEVSKGEGRTVLFVSHNMGAIQSLCVKGIFLNNGAIENYSEIRSVIETYSSFRKIQNHNYEFPNKIPENQVAFIKSIEVLDKFNNKVNELSIGKNWKIKVNVEVRFFTKNLIVAFGMLNDLEMPVRSSWSQPFDLEKGSYEVYFEESEILFSPGKYRILLSLSHGRISIQYIETDLYLTISNTYENIDSRIIETQNGIILNQMSTSVQKIN
jgi:lipopolysaccharide transport system ATP-binding protein